jgi:hypothetical protein
MIDKRRNVVKVINKMLEVIPNEQTQLIDDLNIYKTSLRNQPIEVLKSVDSWRPLISIMNNIKTPDLNSIFWITKVYNLWNNHNI